MTTHRKDRSNFDIEQYKEHKALYKLLNILMEQDSAGTEASHVLNRVARLNTLLNVLTISIMTTNIKLYFLELLRKEFYKENIPMDCIQERLLNNHYVGIINRARELFKEQRKEEKKELDEEAKLSDSAQNENYIEELVDMEIEKGLISDNRRKDRIAYYENKPLKFLGHARRVAQDSKKE